MSWRNLRQDPASHHLVGDFASGPLANRTLLRLLTGQRHHLTGLLRRDLRWTARSGFIRESLTDLSISERDPMPRQPAVAPGAHCIHTHLLFLCDLAIILSGIGCQDDAGTQGHLLRRAVPTHQRLQLRSLHLAQGQRFWFRSSHGWVLFLFSLRSQYTTELFQPQCTRAIRIGVPMSIMSLCIFAYVYFDILTILVYEEQ